MTHARHGPCTASCCSRSLRNVRDDVGHVRGKTASTRGPAGEELTVTDRGRPIARLGRVAADDLAQRFALPGSDAVHLAAAARVRNPRGPPMTVMAAGGGELCAAAEGIGLAAARTHGEG